MSAPEITDALLDEIEAKARAAKPYRYAWDDSGEPNAAHIARMDSPTTLALVAAYRKAILEQERLARLVYVPGMWKCAKCSFVCITSYLNVHDGSVSAKTDPGERCPNCDVPLWRVTERDAGNEMIDRCDKAVQDERVAVARAEVAEARVGELEEALEPFAYEGRKPDAQAADTRSDEEWTILVALGDLQRAARLLSMGDRDA